MNFLVLLFVVTTALSSSSRVEEVEGEVEEDEVEEVEEFLLMDSFIRQVRTY